MAPPTALAAEGVCSGFLEGLDLVTEARKVGPRLQRRAAATSPTTASTTGDRRSLHSLKRARVAAPPSHLASGGLGLLALRLKLFLELLQAAAALLHVAEEAGAMDLHAPPLLEGTQAGNARVHGAHYPEDQISVPEEGLRRGKWGGNAEEAAVYGLA